MDNILIAICCDMRLIELYIDCSYFNEAEMSLILPAKLEDKIKHIEQ